MTCRTLWAVLIVASAAIWAALIIFAITTVQVFTAALELIGGAK